MKINLASLVAALLATMAMWFATPRASGFTDCYAPDPDDMVYAVAIQPDGKILLGGLFKTVRGAERKGLARLNPDGSLDTSFNPGAHSGTEDAGVFSLALQPDGKILVGGFFTNLAGSARSNIGRLNSNGSVDASFNPGANDWVRCLALQTNGQILAGGWFTTVSGTPRTNLARLNGNGTLDGTFNPGVDEGVLGLAVQADQKILVGGAFTRVAGQSRAGLARLEANGTLDPSFTSGVAHPLGGYVSSLAITSTGQILAGGLFNTLGGQSRTNLGRLNSNGSLDASFNPRAFYPGQFDYNGCVGCLRVQADGMILVGGKFTQLGGQARNNIGRLTSSGTVDTSFNPDVGGSFASVECLAAQSDGKIIVGGQFMTLDGQSRDNLGRLTTNGSFDISFNPPAIAGPEFPPPWSYSFTQSGEPDDDQIGRAAGKIWSFTNAIPAGTIASWGATNGGVKLSFDDSLYAGQEVLSYRPDLSDPTNGRAVWSGQTLAPVSGSTVYTRFVLTVTNQVTGNALPLFEAGSLRLPANIGGLVSITNSLQFKAVLRFQASYDLAGTYTPALDFFDSLPKSPPETYKADSSFAAGFYYLTNSFELNRIVRLLPGEDAVKVQFQILPGRPCVLECSTNLTTWKPVSTNAADGYGVAPLVHQSPPSSRAFYRVRCL